MKALKAQFSPESLLPVSFQSYSSRLKNKTALSSFKSLKLMKNKSSSAKIYFSHKLQR